MSIDTVVLLCTGSFGVGGLFGIWSANRNWAEKGEEGYPRMLYRGNLYWVNREDKPCFRCTPYDTKR